LGIAGPPHRGYNKREVRASAAVVALTATLCLATGATASARGAGPVGTRYTVAFTSSSLPANVDKLVADAGGTIAVRMPQIGGLGVVSSSPSFVAKMSSVASVAAATRSIKTSLEPVDEKQFEQGKARQSRERHEHGGKAAGVGVDPQSEPDQLGSEQWDKMRMNVSSTGSYAVNRGRREVRVALTDTGVDVTHPDIAPNLDVADSRSFVPEEPTIQDYNGHGTWTASAVAAPINTVGISGVAPNVSIVALKTNDLLGNGQQIYIDEALIYAADKGFDIVSSSIISYSQTCVGMPAGSCDSAEYILAQRAVDYARARGVTIIAALGNDNLNLADRAGAVNQFIQWALQVQQDFGPVAEVLGTLNGVIGVSSTGYLNEKAFYSNYGAGSVGVAAPGGDPFFQVTPGYATPGGVLGAWSSTAEYHPPYTVQPTYMTQDCAPSVGCGPYAWQIGTSMAAPNAAGVAALIVSRYGDFSNDNRGNNNDNRGDNNDNNGNGNGNGNQRGNNDERGTHMRPEKVERYLLGSAVPLPCPSPSTVVYGGGYPYDSATCQGNARSNSFYGAGLVNALSALTLKSRESR
jgi:hypothetical protein